MPYYKDRADEVGAMAAAIIKNASDIRRCGSAALAMCYAACGRTAAMLEGLVERMEEELGYKTTVIATGGIAQFITPLCKREIKLERDLLLKGLNIIYKKNVHEKHK